MATKTKAAPKSKSKFYSDQFDTAMLKGDRKTLDRIENKLPGVKKTATPKKPAAKKPSRPKAKG